MRRVLLFAYFYPPLAGGGVHRVLSFTRHLPAHGWACTVVCAGENDYWVTDDSLTAVVPRETEVLRVAGGSGLSAWLRLRREDAKGRRSGRAFTPLRAAADWLMLPDSYAGWAKRARATVASRIAHGGIDVLLSSSPPDSVHVAAADVAHETAVPWVADFRDPWVGLQFRTPPTPWHAATHRTMESRVLAGAALVLAVRPAVLRPIVIVLLVAVAVFTATRHGPPRLATRIPPARGSLAVAAIALVLGAYDGFFGPGTGTFLIVAFASLLGDSLQRASGEAKAVNFASNLAALALFAARGVVMWRVALPMAAAQLLGGTLGAHLVVRKGDVFVRRVVLAVVLALVVKLGTDLVSAAT